MIWIVGILIAAGLIHMAGNTIVYVAITKKCLPEDLPRFPWSWRVMISLAWWSSWLQRKGLLG